MPIEASLVSLQGLNSMETLGHILSLVSPGDCIFTLDLMDAHLHVSLHPWVRWYLVCIQGHSGYPACIPWAVHVEGHCLSPSMGAMLGIATSFRQISCYEMLLVGGFWTCGSTSTSCSLTCSQHGLCFTSVAESYNHWDMTYHSLYSVLGLSQAAASLPEHDPSLFALNQPLTMHLLDHYTPGQDPLSHRIPVQMLPRSRP